MNVYDAIETAYKNGFEAGKASMTKHGLWEAMYDSCGKLVGWIHRDCGRVTIEASNYCPSCGTKMSVK